MSDSLQPHGTKEDWNLKLLIGKSMMKWSHICFSLIRMSISVNFLGKQFLLFDLVIPFLMIYPKIWSCIFYYFLLCNRWLQNWIGSDQISRSVVSDSLRPHESQHARPPCPSPTPRVHSNSRPSSQWCHSAISSSADPFSSCPQSLPASESFPISQPFAWGGRSTGVSALASFLPKKSQGWSPSEWTG